MIAYTLNKEINCGNICNDIQKLITKFQQNNPNSRAVLVIEMKPIIDSLTTTEPLRIENKL